MKRVNQTVPRFGHSYAWANRILRIDLTTMSVAVHESAPYVPQYLGARGIAARICWDEYPAPVGAFDPANPLMVLPGALTGSRSPYSGRTVVCAFSPQGYPHPWFTRSSIGGHFGGELRRAGYDGLVVIGDSPTPVRIRIRDDEIQILPADDLWGADTMETLDAIAAVEGRQARSLVIGPAGEHLSRIATIHTASASACGQGGFGAVMGSKRLKAISVIGSGRVSLAHPHAIAAISKALARTFAEDGQVGPLNFYGDIRHFDRQLAAGGDGRATCRACTESCITPCAAYLRDVPGVAHDRAWSGHWVCVGTRFQGFDPDDTSPLRSVYDWHLERRAAFRLSVLSNRYGLNQADLIGGIVPWLIACQRSGLIDEIDGRPIDWSSPIFWASLMHAIAYREGLGDTLSEGGWAASQILSLGEDLARERYPGWGYSAHCDGREGGRLVFPYWVVSALQWLADTRDPFGSGHGYLWADGLAERAAHLEGTARVEALDRLCSLGQRVYGSPDAVDPYSGYSGKAYPGYYQMLRAVIKDCLPIDAHFPLIYRASAPDGYWRLSNVEGIGEIEGPAVEYRLFVAGTGLDWSEQQFLQAAERVCTIERALQVRHWGRDREMDETVLPYFERTELYQNPFLDRRYGLDREQFKSVIDAFYALHGWDAERGWPTLERLSALGLADVYAPMVEDAARATATGNEHGQHSADPRPQSPTQPSFGKEIPVDRAPIETHLTVPTDQTCFFTLVGTPEGARNARLLIQSLRDFGGGQRRCPVWVFVADPDRVPWHDPDPDTCAFPLIWGNVHSQYVFAAKVCACTQAERLAKGRIRSLVWMNPQCLIVRPPVLFDLAPSFDAAFRTVHIRNIGSPAAEPIDAYWSEIYRAVGVTDVPFKVESFVDGQELRPYLNTHCFSIDPAMDICSAWQELFEAMVADQAFQSGPCRDELHRVFLHQAILSALIAERVDVERLRLLPPEYSYPLHFHQQVPPIHRVQFLDDLVCAVYEQDGDLQALEAQEPLRSWLRQSAGETPSHRS